MERLLDELEPLIGGAHRLHRVHTALRTAAMTHGASVVGAMLVSCSDESEHEAAESFRQTFARSLVPRLKFGQRTPFRTANLGGRYEWHSLRLAERHFATEASARQGKLMLVKIGAHVGVETPAGAPFRYGTMRRYDEESPCCGQLLGLLAGDESPASAELAELFASEDVDRLSAIRELEERVRPLVAAVVSARLQARQAVIDAQEHVPKTPTVYLVLTGVTLNHRDEDSELVVGAYVVDRMGPSARGLYTGLGDRPAAYRLEERHGKPSVADDEIGRRRAIRDHRELVGGHALRDLAPHVRAQAQSVDVAERAHGSRSSAGDDLARRWLLKALLAALAELAPVPTVLFLFAEGAIDASQVWRAHRLAAGRGRPGDTETILDGLEHRLERLTPQQVSRLLRRLRPELGRGWSGDA